MVGRILRHFFIRPSACTLSSFVALAIGISTTSFVFISCSSNPIIDYPEHSERRVRPFRFRHNLHVVKDFEQPAKTVGPDRMLFLLDRSLALFELGKYRDSNKMLWQAEKLSNITRFDTKDKLRSTSTRNTQRKFYHGDPHESIMVSVFHSLNYAFLQRDEDAIHEVRRALHKIRRLNLEGDQRYPIDFFYNYFSGILYERQKLWQEAYVDYKRAAELNPNSISLQRDLVRLAARLDSDIDLAKWRGSFGLTEQDVLESYRANSRFGSVVILYQNGFHAVKRPHEQYRELPIYKPAENQYVSAQVYVNDKVIGEVDRALDIDALAFTDSARREALYEKDKSRGFPSRRNKKSYDVRKHPGYDKSSVKAVERQTEYLEADLRRWTTLPQSLHIYRAHLPPGNHRIMLRLKKRNGRWGPIRDLGEVVIRFPGDIQLISYRSFNESAGNVR